GTSQGGHTSVLLLFEYKRHANYAGTHEEFCPASLFSAKGTRHPKPATPVLSIYLTKPGQTPLLCAF
ncbi:MAG: hypothetical protein ACN6OP_06035, partial [Pseudomonadales bacterium]